MWPCVSSSVLGEAQQNPDGSDALGLVEASEAKVALYDNRSCFTFAV